MYYIGVDLGGTNIAVGVVDDSGKIHSRKILPTPKTSSEKIIDAMIEGCQEAVKASGISFLEIAGVGVACPGWIEPHRGYVVASSNLPFKDLPLAELMSSALNKDVRMHNDANCAALAEAKWGGAKGCDNAVMLTIGTGLGGAVIINGKLYEGSGAVTELGHTVIQINGEQCSCGLKGCCEAYVSAAALVRQAKKAATENPHSLLYTLCGGDISAISGETPFLAAAKGDKTAQDVISNYIDYLAHTVTNYINIFRPQVFIIGGGLSNQGKNLFDPLNKRVLELSRSYAYGHGFPPIVKAELGNDAGIYGAAALFIT